VPPPLHRGPSYLLPLHTPHTFTRLDCTGTKNKPHWGCPTGAQKLPSLPNYTDARDAEAQMGGVYKE